MAGYSAERAATNYKAWLLSAICFFVGGGLFWLFGGAGFAEIARSFATTLISIGAIVINLRTHHEAAAPGGIAEACGGRKVSMGTQARKRRKIE